MFSPFNVALFICVAIFIYFRSTSFSKKRWLFLLFIIILANVIFFLQYSHGTKKIDAWYENKNEYSVSYYADIYDSKTKQLTFSHIKVDLKRPVLAHNDCENTGYRYFVDVCSRKIAIQKIYLPDGKILDYKEGFQTFLINSRTQIFIDGKDYNLVLVEKVKK